MRLAPGFLFASCLGESDLVCNCRAAASLYRFHEMELFYWRSFLIDDGFVQKGFRLSRTGSFQISLLVRMCSFIFVFLFSVSQL